MQHTHERRNQEVGLKREGLVIAFFLNLSFTVIEIGGAYWTGSVTVLSDALHDLGDTVALAAAVLLERLARRERTVRFSYGFRRFSLLSAFLNGLILIGGSLYILIEASNRLLNPQEVYAPGMVVLAFFGILVNGGAALLLSKGRTMNEKMVSWHLLDDVIGWFVVLISGTVLVFKPIPYLDPAVSFVFVGIMLWNAIKLFRETVFLFLQGSPRAPSLLEIETQILSIDGVLSIHDSHIWSLDGQRHIITLHVVIIESLKFVELFSIRTHIRKIISGYGIADMTVEIERESDHCELTVR